MTAYVIDPYYLTISFLITLGWQLLGFAIAYTLQFDLLTDAWGGINFFALALATLLMGGTYHARNIVASVLMMIWAVRLGGFLLFRVIKTGGDGRFDEMRAHPLKFGGFWSFQILWVWTVSLHVVILNSPIVSTSPNFPAFGTSRDIAGVVLFALGFVVEALGDQQKYNWKSNNPPKNVSCDAGVWKWSRHPPYFGEIMLHWGLWILALSPSTNGQVPLPGLRAQYGAIFSPLITMALLMFLSGLPIAEKSAGKKFFLMSHGQKADSSDNGATWTRYKAYLSRTSILIPIPPSLYGPLPAIVKKTLLLDLPFYKFDEQKDGREAKEEEAKKNGGDA